MLGAILGDIIGSPYEFDSHNIKTVDFPLLTGRSHFTDDTVMTVAVARALMETRGQSDEAIRAALVRQMQTLGRAYPHAGYGGRFRSWLASRNPQPYNSYGNGSGMRVSPAGWLATTLEEALHLAKLTAEVTHNHPEGIKGAQAVAGAIFLARGNTNKRQIAEWIQNTFRYDLTFTLDEIRPGYRMDTSCQGSVPQAIRAFLEGKDFEDAVRLAVSIGGDSDTIACMAGGIAEACYGIPDDIAQAGLAILRQQAPDLFETVPEFRSFCQKDVGGTQKRQEPDPEESADLDSTAVDAAITNWYLGGAEDLTPVYNAVALALRQEAQILLPIEPPAGFPVFENAENLAVGDILTAEDEIHFTIRHLSDGDGTYRIPVFTDVEQLHRWEGSSAIVFSLRSLMETVLDWASCTGIAVNPSGQRLDFPKDCIRKLLQFQPESHITVLRGDITAMHGDVIVNASRHSLENGSGVNGAIHSAAGPELARACAQLGGCATGEVKATSGYRLPARYVFHTVGPRYHTDPHPAALLAACYRNCLDLAMRHDLHSIAFPCISTGVFRYPPDEAAVIALNTIRTWVRANETYVMNVYLCCRDNENMAAYYALPKKTPNLRG